MGQYFLDTQYLYDIFSTLLMNSKNFNDIDIMIYFISFNNSLKMQQPLWNLY